ncbi:MAG: glycosyltransferase family protein [Candidatus Thorarchaeota archaeon]|jgi:hypothetical protein
MRILVNFRQDVRDRVKPNVPIECYAKSAVKYLELQAHDVTTCGDNQTYNDVEDAMYNCSEGFDLFLDLDNGRDPDGELRFALPKYKDIIKCPSAVWFVDSHGHPTLHKRTAVHYDHVFFAVWAKRDLFAKHPSAHWLPNSTDMEWFGCSKFVHVTPHIDFGFYGSKTGLDRADPMVAVCEKNGWSYEVKQVGKAFRHKWPQTGEAMSACHNLFNRGQKHDGPNLRVLESMAVCRPLLTDLDPTDGMSKIFEDGVHFIGYTPESLEEKMKWMMDNPKEAELIGQAGYDEVRRKHTIKHRVHDIIQVIKNAKSTNI